MEGFDNKRKGYYRIFPEDWQVVSVASLLKRVKAPVKVSPSTTYREIGIRSHGKGIFHKSECMKCHLPIANLKIMLDRSTRIVHFLGRNYAF